MFARAQHPQRFVAGALLVACAVVAFPSRAERVHVGPDTQLRLVEFAIVGDRTFSDDELKGQLAQRTLGKHPKWRGAFDFLPFVDALEPAPFDPVELQRDVVRLREFYRHAGFPATDVRYVLRPQPGQDAVNVVFQITEGHALALRAVKVVGPDGRALDAWLPANLLRSWRNCEKDLARERSRRMGEEQLQANARTVRGWFGDHGYPYVVVNFETAVDADQRAGEQILRVEPGSRARVRSIEVTGNQRVKTDAVSRMLPSQPGDWYSATEVADGQRQLMGLNLFHVAKVEVVGQPTDSLVDLRVHVEESKARLIGGEFGYLSDNGLTVRGEWEHRNFRGGARTLTVSAVAQTGVWAWEDDPEKLLRGSVALQQPRFLGPYISLVTTPYVEYRDDYRDRSWKTGFDGTLVYVRDAWLRTLSLKYGISVRRLLEYRSGTGGSYDFFDLVQAALDSLGERTYHSGFTLAATLGSQDHPVRPRRALLFRPSVEVTAPSPWNTAEFTKLDLTVNVQRPLARRTSFTGRLAGGRMYPFGDSRPTGSDVDDLERYLELRDYIFTAGGTGDVRGWDSRMLGPKFPDLYEDANTGRLLADRYTPIGGLARLAVDAELRTPFPFLPSPWGAHLFVDGGKVWAPGGAYVGEDDFDQERFSWAAGTGIHSDTPVGPVRLSFAYMLNPTALDVLKPQEFLDALAAGTLDQAHTAWNRRLRIHLSIGTGF